MHISSLMDRNIFALSGGEKQKIAIAAVYALNPEIFVFDEPSSSLDMDLMIELSKLMERLKEEGKTIIIAEHRLWYLKKLWIEQYIWKMERLLKNTAWKKFKTYPRKKDVEQGFGTRISPTMHGKKDLP